MAPQYNHNIVRWFGIFFWYWIDYVELMTGLFRFLVSFSFYCLLEASHWLPIATNTTVTVIFLAVKVRIHQELAQKL